MRSIDLHVPAGTTLALVGESGSGKSSIVQLACRFYDPDMGKVDTGCDLPLSNYGSGLSAAGHLAEAECGLSK